MRPNIANIKGRTSMKTDFFEMVLFNSNLAVLVIIISKRQAKSNNERP
jgi:hypothetical protein